MFRPTRLLSLGVLALLGSGLDSPAVGRSPETSDPSFQEVIDVDIVNVEVFVVDKRGRPMGGLSRGDFQLFVDGKPVSLTNFLAVEDGLRYPESRTVTSPDQSTVLPPSPRTARGEKAQGSDPLHLVIYVDSLNSRPAGRQRSLEQLQRFVRKRLWPGDRVMVVDYNQSLGVRLPFTTDHQAVEQALEEILATPALGMRLDRVRKETLGLATQDDCEQAGFVARNYATQTYAQAEASYFALQSLVGSLAGIPGVKALLYVNDGLQMRAGEEVFVRLAGLCPGLNQSLMAMPADYDLSRTLGRLTAHANSNRVTMFPLEAIGITTYSSSDIEIGPRTNPMTAQQFDSSVAPTWAENDPPLNVGGPGTEEAILDQIFTAGRQGSLTYLARQTGGQAVLNANNLLPDLNRIDDQLRNYYSLGFQPIRQEHSGRIHRLAVRVAQPDLQVVYRQSFADLTWSERTADRLRSLVAYGGNWDNPLDLEVETLGSEKLNHGLYKARLRLRVPVAKLLLTSTVQGRLTGNLELFMTSQDVDGNRSDVKQFSLPVAYSASRVEEQPDLGFVHNLDVTLRAESRTLGVALLDQGAATAAFVNHEITPSVD